MQSRQGSVFSCSKLLLEPENVPKLYIVGCLITETSVEKMSKPKVIVNQLWSAYVYVNSYTFFKKYLF